MKDYADNRRHAKPTDLGPGDPVLVEQPRRNKTTPAYDSDPYIVTDRKGSRVTAKRGHKQITRNSSFFKRIDDSHMRLQPQPQEPDEDSASVVEAPTPVRHRPVPIDQGPDIPDMDPIPMTPVVTPRTPRHVPRHAVPSTPVTNQRPQRVRKQPIWMKDYAS